MHTIAYLIGGYSVAGIFLVCLMLTDPVIREDVKHWGDRLDLARFLLFVAMTWPLLVVAKLWPGGRKTGQYSDD